jgi:hypothetical protein
MWLLVGGAVLVFALGAVVGVVGATYHVTRSMFG